MNVAAAMVVTDGTYRTTHPAGGARTPRLRLRLTAVEDAVRGKEPMLRRAKWPDGWPCRVRVLCGSTAISSVDAGIGSVPSAVWKAEWD